MKQLVKYLVGLVWVLMLLESCQSEQKSAEVGTNEPTTLRTNLEDVRLREAPGEDAKVIAALLKGTVLYDLGEVSDFTTKIKLRGIEFDEPWLKVRTETGTIGWVYGGALNFTMSDSSQLAGLLMEKRLTSLFGPALADSMTAYRQAFQSMQTDADVANVYRRGTALREQVTNVMQDKIAVTDPEQLPDLFWLEQAMPGFVAQLVAEGTAYYLFWEYDVLLQKAQKTSASTDDNFFKLATALFPDDSVEYWYPAWFLQTWDYGGSSLLGRGIHDRILKQMDETLQKSDQFATEIRQWKTLLFNDITQPDVNYWEAQDKILAELDTILVRNYSILTQADKVALQTRRKHFEDPAAHKIAVNQQSGN